MQRISNIIQFYERNTLPIRTLDRPALHIPNLLQSFLPFLNCFCVIFLTVQSKCFLVRTLLMSNISRLHHIENRQYDAVISLFTPLHHQS
ncbi:hypothetical protein LINPERPRIM_LOCUS11923 [Linum perenne]